VKSQADAAGAPKLTRVGTESVGQSREVEGSSQHRPAPATRDDESPLESKRGPRTVVVSVLIAAIAFGIAARFVRYAAGLNLWGDEAYVAVNIVERTPLQLMQPLDDRQVAPPLWLWAARWSWLAVGDLRVMRLPALISGLAALLVFTLLARRITFDDETWWAIALFAASEPMIRYSVELKPYAGDALAATLILTCAAYAFLPPFPATGERTRTAPVWLLALLLPVLLWLSYPALIVTAGIGLWASAVLISRRPHGRWTWFGCVTCLATTGTAAGMLGMWVIGPARQRVNGFMQSVWAASFPPLDHPWLWPWWLLEVHTGRMMSYPAGDTHFASSGTFVLLLCGVIALWHPRTQLTSSTRAESRRPALGLLLSLMVAAIAMAFAKLYPYGGYVRTMLYLSPVICLLVAAGIERIARWLRADHAAVWRTAMAIVLLIVPIVVSARAVHERVQQRRLADVGDELRWVNDEATRLGSPVVCYNKLDPHTGDGSKVQFELYMMTELHTPVVDAGRVPWDTLAPGATFFAIVYSESTSIRAPSDTIATWQSGIEQRATVVAHRAVMMDVDSTSKLDAFQYRMLPAVGYPEPPT
jgi:hypothetical protein